MTVWHLIATMRIERETPDHAAKNFGLPLEAVREAMDYYTRHKDIVEADTKEEKRILVEEFYFQRNPHPQLVAIAPQIIILKIPKANHIGHRNVIFVNFGPFPK